VIREEDRPVLIDLYVCVRDNVVFDSLIYLEPLERFTNRS